jgi:hypothetical protein
MYYKANNTSVNLCKIKKKKLKRIKKKLIESIGISFEKTIQLELLQRKEMNNINDNEAIDQCQLMDFYNKYKFYSIFRKDDKDNEKSVLNDLLTFIYQNPTISDFVFTLKSVFFILYGMTKNDLENIIELISYSYSNLNQTNNNHTTIPNLYKDTDFLCKQEDLKTLLNNNHYLIPIILMGTMLTQEDFFGIFLKKTPMKIS